MIVAGLVPLVVIGLKDVGGYSGLKEKVTHTALGSHSFSTWGGTNVGHWTNPLGDWIGIVIGLGFVLSFGYWTTNFAEVQRALSAKDLSAPSHPADRLVPEDLHPRPDHHPGPDRAGADSQAGPDQGPHL